MNGGMGVMVGMFAPANPAQWPPVDRDDAAFLADLAILMRKGVAPDSTGMGAAHRH